MLNVLTQDAPALALAAAPGAAVAHVRWFIPEGAYPPDWGRLFAPPTLAVFAASGLLYLALRWLQRLAGTPHFPRLPLLTYMEPGATVLLAVQTGISLIFLASQGDLFASNLSLPPTKLGWLLAASQIGVAFTFITGLFDRAGALLLLLVYLLGFLVFPSVSVLDQMLYVGIGLALFVLGRTSPPPAVARRLLFLRAYRRHGVAALRVLTGLSVLLVAFTEKLLAPEAGLAFLREYPGFNVPRTLLGWPWATDELFVLAAAVGEATIGVLLAIGVLTRVVILVMWVPFNLTVGFLPPVELLAHLPIFGIMFILLLYGSGLPPEADERRLLPAPSDEHAARQPAELPMLR